jgi:hypothetical protein
VAGVEDARLSQLTALAKEVFLRSVNDQACFEMVHSAMLNQANTVKRAQHLLQGNAEKARDACAAEIRNPLKVRTKGRPKTGAKRILSQAEKQRSKKKAYRSTKCGKCGECGHNARTCTEIVKESSTTKATSEPSSSSSSSSDTNELPLLVRKVASNGSVQALDGPRFTKRQRINGIDMSSEYNESAECFCAQSKKDAAQICCDKCQRWYHIKCVKVSSVELERLSHTDEEYYCPTCRKSEESA